jgi:hypothetical protein
VPGLWNTAEILPISLPAAPMRFIWTHIPLPLEKHAPANDRRRVSSV